MARTGRPVGRPPAIPCNRPDGKRVIKRYSNRRLYDTRASRYIAISEIGLMDRGSFVVVDAKDGRDLTDVAITQLAADKAREKDREKTGAAEIVYFIQSGDNGPIKIGLSTIGKLDSRLSALQTGNPSKLAVLGYVEGNRSAEQFLHRCFARHSIGGEWFTPAPDLLSFITDTIARGESIAREEESAPVQLYLVS